MWTRPHNVLVFLDIGFVLWLVDKTKTIPYEEYTAYLSIVYLKVVMYTKFTTSYFMSSLDLYVHHTKQGLLQFWVYSEEYFEDTMTTLASILLYTY